MANNKRSKVFAAIDKLLGFFVRKNLFGYVENGFIFVIVISIVNWILGFAMNTYNDTPLVLLPLTIQLTFFTFFVFGLGFLFFGFLTPIAMFIAGSMTSVFAKFTGWNAFTIATIPCAFLAAYASARLGTALYYDLKGRGNFRESLKVAIAVMAFAFLFSMALDYAV